MPKDAADLAQRQGRQVQAPRRGGDARQGHVHLLGAHRLAALLRLEAFLPRGEALLQAHLEAVDLLAETGAVFGCGVAHARHEGAELALAAQVGQTPRLEGVRRSGLLQL